MREFLVVAHSPEYLAAFACKIPKNVDIYIVWSEDQAVQMLSKRDFDGVIRLAEYKNEDKCL